MRLSRLAVLKNRNGAHASSILYSIVETAKAYNLIPFDSLHHIIDVLGKRQGDETLNE